MRDVLCRVGDPVAQPDHGRLMADGVHTGESAGDRSRIAYVGAGIRPDVVHDRLVPVRRQRLDDMGPDEPGTAGDQYTHTATLGPAARGRAGPRSHVMTP